MIDFFFVLLVLFVCNILLLNFGVVVGWVDSSFYVVMFDLNLNIFFYKCICLFNFNKVYVFVF